LGNTATGAFALSKSTGDANTANGAAALENDTTGEQNTAIGFNALQSDTTGNFNTAIGTGALSYNSTTSYNTATGYNALGNSTTGNSNTAIGVNALGGQITLTFNAGSNNTAIGQNALQGNTTGSSNIALGFNAGGNLTTGYNNIDIGSQGVGGESNTTRIGTMQQTATFITGIRGTSTANANAVPVVIDSAGQLGTVSSSRRFKDEIKPMDNSSEAILGLKPVTFHYKTDKQNTPQFGLIAEEVAKVNPDLVVRDENGEIYTVHYEAVNAMLLNEFLKEHRKVAGQQSIIAELKMMVAQQQKQIATQQANAAQQQKQIEALTATVQKVSERVELSAPAPQIAANDD